MKPARYPEVTTFTGFGSVVGPMDDQVRVLGMSGDQVRIERWSRKGRPREWWPRSHPLFRGLVKFWPAVSGVAPTSVPESASVPAVPRQASLFGVSNS